MKKLISTVVSALLVASAIVVSPLGVQTATAAPADIQRIIQDTNDYRAENGLPPLIENPAINDVAAAWSSYQSEQQSSYHNPDYMKQIPAGWSAHGENVGHGFGSATIVDAWINSEPHKRNLLGDYTDVGIGYVVDASGHTWITQNFGKYPPTVADAPSNASLTLASANSVTVNWTAPAFNGRSNITGYKVVLVNTKDNTETVLTVNASTLTATYANRLPGTSYKAYVVAVNGIGNSVHSNTTKVVKVPAVVPSGLATPAVAVAKTGIKVTWVAPTNLGGAELNGYDVTLTPSAGETVTTSFPANTVTAVIANVEPGVSYTATYVAKNEAGSSAVSAASAAITAPLQAPDAVDEPVAVLSGENNVSVTWVAPVKNGGSTVTGYVVNLVRLFDNETVTKNVSSLNTVFTGLNPGAEYAANVTAVNAVGKSGVSSNSNTVLVPAVVADAPAAPKLTLTDENEITVNWGASAYDGGAEVTEYVVTLTKSSGEVTSVTVPAEVRVNVFTNLLPNGKYTATVVAVNSAGSSAASASSVVLQLPPEPSQPDPINTLEITDISSTTAIASWEAPFNGGAKISGYVVSVYNINNELVKTQKVDGVTLTTEITGLTRATNYTVEVAAENKIGVGISPSSVNVKTLAEKPSAPLNVVITATGAETAKVVWDAPTDNGGSMITTYSVEIFNNGEVVEFGTVTNNELKYVAAGLQSGLAYSVKVTAYNQSAGSDASAESNTVTTFTVSEAPAGTPALTFNAKKLTATVTWNAPVKNGGADVTEYKVSLADSNGVVATKNATQRSTSFSGLKPGGVYTVTVQALNSVGYSAASTASNTVTVPAVKSDAPESVKVTLNGSDGVNATWVAPGYTGGGAITGYKVVLVPADKNEKTVVYEANASETNHVFAGLTPGDSYSVKVLVVNSAGESVYTNSAKIKIPATVPSAVNNPTLKLSKDKKNLDATWAAPTNDGGNTITGYKAVLTGTDGTTISVTVKALKVSFTTLTRGVTYSLTVFAVNSAGVSADAVTSNTVTIPSGVPNAPTNVNVIVNNSQSVTVTWKAPVSDGGSAITSYEVVLFSKGEIFSSQIVGPEKRDAVFAGLTELTKYNAVVYAINEVGVSPKSAKSNTVKTAPASAPAAVEQNELTEANAGSVTAELDGETLNVTPEGDFVAGDWVFGYAYSTPFALGWAQIQADGSVQWDISAANLEAGAHRIALYDASGVLAGWTGFTVAAAPGLPSAPVAPAPESPVTETPVASPVVPAAAAPTEPVAPTVVKAVKTPTEKGLAHTGSDVQGVLGTGLFILFLGGALLLASLDNRRRKGVTNK